MAARRLCGLVLAVAVAASSAAGAEEVAALYRASWAGLPAGEIRLTLRDDPAVYRNEIAIRTEGLARRGGDTVPKDPDSRSASRADALEIH